MSGALVEALLFLVRTAFELYLLAVALRFLLQLVRADFYNPLSQFLVRVTNPPLRPLRRLLPGYGGIDWASVVFMLLIKLVEIVLLALIAFGRVPAPPGLVVIGIAQILNLVVYIFFFAIIIQVILSWVSPGAYNPATLVLHSLTEPLLRPVRRRLPPAGGLDFSPFVVLILLQLSLILLVRPLERTGVSMAGYTGFFGG